jgi:serine/threonine protein kinase
LFLLDNEKDILDSDYLLILEYADGSTLRNYLKNNFYKLDWNIKLQFAIQIANAVSYIHQNDIIHCNLVSTVLVFKKSLTLIYI